MTSKFCRIKRSQSVVPNVSRQVYIATRRHMDNNGRCLSQASNLVWEIGIGMATRTIN